MTFYLNFSFLGYKVVNKRKMDLFEGNKYFGFRIISGRIEKYKPTLSKSNSS